jgi:membrane protein implicated in regulation of membrane protease activity
MQMSIPMIVAGVVLWALNILTAWSMISAGYPLVVVFTAAVAVLFTLLVTRRRSARGGSKLGTSRENLRPEPLKTSV